MSDSRIVTSESRATKLWHGVIGDLEFREQNKDIIDSLLQGDYNPADLERLNGHRVVRSLRRGIKPRFLLTTFTYNERNYLLPLELLENHEYDKSRFLQPGVLENWVEKQIPELIAQIRELEGEGKTTAREEEKPKPYRLTGFDYVARKVIEFNSEQEEGRAVPLPAIIRGAPGSGKTLLLLERAKEFLAQHPDPNVRVLFYTDHPALIDDVKKLWDLPGEPRIEFRSKRELIEEQDPPLKDAMWVGFNEFSAWMDNYVKAYLGQCKAGGKKISAEFKSFLEAREGQYSAFQQIAAEEGFKSIGKKQTNYDQEQRDFLLKAFAAYHKKNLTQADTQTKKRRFDPKLQKFTISKKYDLVLHDEYQDSSRVELEETWQLTKELGQICYAGDQLQNVTEAKSQLQSLTDVMHKDHLSETIVPLPFSFRCPPVSVKVLNALIKFLYNVSGGQSDAFEQTAIAVATQASGLPQEQQTSQGSFVWLDDVNSLVLQEFITANEKAIYAVIVPDNADKEELRKIYRGATLLTTREIKGREYKKVIVHNPFADDIKLVTEACRKFNPATAGQQAHLPKPGQGDDSFNKMVHKWIVDVSRNLETCIFIQPTTNQTKKLKQFVLKEAGLLESEIKLNKTVVKEASTEEVEAEVRQLLLTDNETEAFHQWQSKLGRNRKEFNRFKESILKPDTKEAAVEREVKDTATQPTQSEQKDTIPPPTSTSTSTSTATESTSSTETKASPSTSAILTSPSLLPSTTASSASQGATEKTVTKKSKKSQTPDAEAKTDVAKTPEQMADDLIKNYSKLNLATLLASDQAEYILFDLIIDEKNKWKRLWHFLTDKTFYDDFISLIIQDIRFGKQIVRGLFHHQESIEEINFSLFWKLMRYTLINDEDAKKTSASGEELAAQIKEKASAKGVTLKGIGGQSLDNVIASKIVYVSEKREEGKHVLVSMLVNYDIDAQKFMAFLLHQSDAKFFSTAGKQSLLHFMAAYKSGNEFLDTFFYKYPEQIKQIPLEYFTENNFELLRLMSYHRSVSLTLVFDNFPELAEILKTNDLFTTTNIRVSKTPSTGEKTVAKTTIHLKNNKAPQVTISDMPLFHDSCLYDDLSSYHEGRNILIKISKANKLSDAGKQLHDDLEERLKKLTSSTTDLSQRMKDIECIRGANVTRATSPGSHFFQKNKLGERYEYCQQVFSSVVRCLLSDVAGSNIFVSLMRSKKPNTDPCSALANVFSAQPEFRISFPYDMLIKPHSNQSKDDKIEEEGVSKETFLGVLTSRLSGMGVLAALMTVPNRINLTEFAKALCLFHKDDQGRIYSPLINIAHADIRDNQGRAYPPETKIAFPLLAQVFDTVILRCKEELLAVLSAEYLFKQKAFFQLVQGPQTHKLLLELFKTKPELMAMVSSELLSQVKDYLQSTDHGRHLFSLLTLAQAIAVKVSAHSILQSAASAVTPPTIGSAPTHAGPT